MSDKEKINQIISKLSQPVENKEEDDDEKDNNDLEIVKHENVDGNEKIDLDKEFPDENEQEEIEAKARAEEERAVKELENQINDSGDQQ